MSDISAISRGEQVVLSDMTTMSALECYRSSSLTQPSVGRCRSTHESSYLLQDFEETPTHMSIEINRLEEGHNSYPLVCRRSFSQVSSIKTFDFSTLYTTLPHDKLKTRLKETTHKAFSLICHAVGWYIELKNQKFLWRIPERKILI
jgi:hypothetical protein